METEFEMELRFHFEPQVADRVPSVVLENGVRHLTRLEFGASSMSRRIAREPRHIVARSDRAGRSLWSPSALEGAWIFARRAILVLWRSQMSSSRDRLRSQRGEPAPPRVTGFYIFPVASLGLRLSC